MVPSVGAVHLRGRSESRWSFVVFTSATFLAAWVLQEAGHVLWLAILVLLVAVLSLVYVYRWTLGKIDWLELVYLYVALYGIHFGLRTIYLLYVEPDLYLPQVDMESPQVAQALAVALLGLVTFIWGYISGLGDRMARRLPVVKASRIPRSTVLMAAAAIFVLSLIGRLYLLATGKILAYDATRFTTEPWENFLGYAATFGIVAFVLVVACQMRSHKGIWLFWMFLFPAEMLFWFLRGSRTSVLFAPTTMILLYHYLVRPLSARKVFVLFGLLFVGLTLIYPIHTTYRNVTHFGDIRLWSLPEDLQRQFGAAQDERQNMLIRERGGLFAFHIMIEKFPVVESLALTISFTEQSDYIGGLTLLMVPALWIPEILWPSKYDFLGQANMMAGYILFGTTEPGYGLSLGQVSELYLNFGLVGVAAGMFVVGMLMRALYFYCRLEALGDFGPVIYSVLWIHIVLSHGVPFLMTFGDGIRMFVLMLLLLWMMSVTGIKQGLPASQQSHTKIYTTPTSI